MNWFKFSQYNIKNLSDSQILDLIPPLHDSCHCSIEIFPGGRRVWKTSETACEVCFLVRDRFNSINSTLFLENSI